MARDLGRAGMVRHGFAFYAALFAVAGSLVSRQEELQNVTTPLTMLVLVGFFLAFAVTGTAKG
jgi:ABC-2 type transport system permease protein